MNYERPLISYFRVITHTLTKELNHQSEQLGLTSSQGMFLHRIWVCQEKRHLPVYAKDLEDFFDIKHSTVSGILSRMEAAGYVQVDLSSSDRRYKTIRLTPKAMEIHSQMEDCIMQINTRLVENMSAEEQTEFRRLLQIAANNLGVCQHFEKDLSTQEESKT